MHYDVAFFSRSIKDLESLSKQDVERILGKVEAMRTDLAGDVKRLTNYTPEYRLRVGDHRVLFEIVDSVIHVHRVLHRKDAYRR